MRFSLQFLSGLWYFVRVSAGWERPQDPNGKGHHHRSMRLPSMGDFGATDERPVKRGAASGMPLKSTAVALTLPSLISANTSPQA